MPASSNLLLDFEPSTSSSVLEENSERTSFANTTSVSYSFYKFAPISVSAKEQIARIDAFKNLHENWDHNGAIPPAEMTIDNAKAFIIKADRNLLPFYFSAPGPNGEVSIEFRKGNKEAAVYINPDSTTEIVLNEGNTIIFEGNLEGNYKRLLSFIHG